MDKKSRSNRRKATTPIAVVERRSLEFLQEVGELPRDTKMESMIRRHGIHRAQPFRTHSNCSDGANPGIKITHQKERNHEHAEVFGFEVAHRFSNAFHSTNGRFIICISF